MKLKLHTLTLALMMIVALSAYGQNVGSYIHDMGEALVPYGTITAPNCHEVKIELIGPWGDYGMVNGAQGTEPVFSMFAINAVRIVVDLATLDEDKEQPMTFLGTDDIVSHEGPWLASQLKGTRHAIFMASSGLNNSMTVYTVDLKKLRTLQEGKAVSESQMGVTANSKRGVIILFSDKGHADAFEKAIKKAIVVCKAQ